MADGSVVIDSKFDGSKAEKGFASFQSKMNGVASKMKSIGKGMTTFVTTPLVGLGTASVLTAVKFDDSMRKVRATMGNNLGKTTKEQEKNFIKLTNEAKRLGSTTRYSASEAAAGMEKLALAGWDTNQILAATEPMLNLAAAAGMNLDRAADIVTDTMSAFGMEAKEATRTTDVFAAAMSKSNTDVDQLGEAMKYVSSNAKASGMDLEQTVAILGRFADQGIKGSMAGTTLSSMLRDVKKSAKDGKIAIGDTAVSVYDANGKMRDMTTILADVEKATAGMSDEQRDAALSSVFQSEALKGVNMLMQTGTGNIRNFEKELRNSNGTAAAMKDTMEGGLGGSIRSLMSALEGLAISFGEVLAPHIKNLADFLATLAQRFTELPTGVKEVILIIGGIVAAVGPVILVLGTLAGAISNLAPLFAGLSVPILPLIAILGALVAAGILVWQNWETISQKAQEIWSAIWAFIQPIVQQIGDFITKKFGEVYNWWMQTWPQLQQAFVNIWGFISGFITPIINGIVTLFQWAWPLAESLVKSVWLNIQGVISGALDIIMGVISAFASLFTGDWKGLWESTKKIISGALNLIWNWVQLFGIGKLLKFFTGLVGKLLKPITEMWGKISNVFSQALGKIWGWVTSKFQSIVSTVSGKMGVVRDKINSIWNAITSFFGRILGNIWNTVKSKFQNIVTSVGEKMNAARDKIKSIWDKVMGFFKKINLFNIGKDIIQGLINGIGNLAGAVKKKAGEIANSIKGTFKSLLGIHSPSRVMMELGKFTGQGVEVGLDHSLKGIDKASDQLAAAAIPDIPNIPNMPDIPSLSDLTPSLLKVPNFTTKQDESMRVLKAIQDLAKAVLNQPVEVEIPVIQTNMNVDSRQFATAMNKPMTQAQRRQDFRDKRRYK
ncbi:phage tail tape measure protein [Bacillus haynesii]|uniref:phage tail tape measure protein n=1 Tax=Bacillus haynesii TaxID=1925021 RepID=UPI0022814111|nr:phage tail tape measure protein [Bacillus haynesii]MCY8345050.1 phage tail tape measure protein [Bacillus haynesii]